MKLSLDDESIQIVTIDWYLGNRRTLSSLSSTRFLPSSIQNLITLAHS